MPVTRTIIVRYRDLTVELGGSLMDHQSIIRSDGEVWWGWFMQPYETSPKVLFGELLAGIRNAGPVEGFLFDTGQKLLHSCSITDIKVSPRERGITSPEPEKSPEYYHRGRYPAWFKLNNIQAVHFSDMKLTYADLPTRPDEDAKSKRHIGQRVKSLDELTDFLPKVTLWVVDVEKRS